MFRFVLTLLKHRVTYRFLVVLVAALGCASIVGDTISTWSLTSVLYSLVAIRVLVTE